MSEPELTEAERQMIQVLAQQVILDRAERAVVVGATDKGRTVVQRIGEPSEAEKKWDEILRRYKRPPSEIQGGMFAPEAQKLIDKERERRDALQVQRQDEEETPGPQEG